MIWRSPLVAVTLLCGLLAPTATAAGETPPGFSVILLARPPGFQSVPFDLNEAGESVGYYLDGTLAYRAVRWSPDGTPADLAADGTWSQAHGIADDGSVAGWHGPTLQGAEPAVWDDGGLMALALPGQVDGGSAEGIISDGSVIGRTTFQSRDVALRWTRGVLRPLARDASVADIAEDGTAVGQVLVDGFPRAAAWDAQRRLTLLPSEGDSRARAISSDGRIAGSFTDPDTNGSVPAVWSSQDAAPVPLAPFGARAGVAADVNASGWVVGTSGLDPYNLDGEALLWVADGTVHDLNTRIPAGSGWRLISAVAVNDGGQILGLGTFTGESGQAAFLLTPE